MTTTTPPVEQWTYREIADHTGVTPSTIRWFRSNGYLPDPSGQVGRTPWWSPDVIREWHANRPGRGRWGKRTTSTQDGETIPRTDTAPAEVTHRDVTIVGVCPRTVDRRMIGGKRVRLTTPEPCGRPLEPGDTRCKLHRAIDVRAGVTA